MVITDLPPETIDHIAAALDSPTDTRNLAAVCTQLRLLLSPHHTQFRVIRAPLISPIWKKIAENRLFAKNIRVLEIQSAKVYPLNIHQVGKLDKPVIPAIFQELEIPSVPVLDDDAVEGDAVRRYNASKNAMDLDAEHILVSALKGMSGLTSFRWTRTPPLIDHDQEGDIWITLAKYCTSLNGIDVLDRKEPYKSPLSTDDAAYQRPSLNPKFYLFKGLKSFSLSTDVWKNKIINIESLEKCAEMLTRKCPNLEILKLRYIRYANPNTTAVPASPLFSGPSWTSLRELVLCGFRFNPTELACCLASHPTLEILSLRSNQIDQPLVLSPGVLPRLKRLNTDPQFMLINSILDSTISTPRPLEYIKGLSLNDVFLDSLEQSGSGPSLEKLFMGCRDNHNHLIARLSEIAPNLECLDIYRYFDVDPFLDRSLYTVLCQLPRLRILRGLKLLDSNCEPASANTQVIRALAAACPNLQIISWYVGGLDLGVAIERNGSRVAWSLHKMLLNDLGSVYPHWGERGCGSFQL